MSQVGEHTLINTETCAISNQISMKVWFGNDH